jgi:hypothetical protein
MTKIPLYAVTLLVRRRGVLVNWGVSLALLLERWKHSRGTCAGGWLAVRGSSET